MKKVVCIFMFVLFVIVLSGCKTDCQSGCKSSPFAQYDTAAAVLKLELKRTSQSWDGAQLPDYLKGKPELVVMRYIFPVGSKLPWHHHPVINYGILHQGELTIVGVDGKKQVVHAGEAIIEVVDAVHFGMNTGDKPVILDMFYLSQKGMPLAVQHPEIPMK